MRRRDAETPRGSGRACDTCLVIWLWIVIAVVVVLLLVLLYLFNKVVRLRNEVSTGWSNIDVQLKRRNDLIPNLVETREGLRRPRARRLRGGHEGAGRDGKGFDAGRGRAPPTPSSVRRSAVSSRSPRRTPT